jgi:Domain of unknown function (DUF4145)
LLLRLFGGLCGAEEGGAERAFSSWLSLNDGSAATVVSYTVGPLIIQRGGRLRLLYVPRARSFDRMGNSDIDTIVVHCTECEKSVTGRSHGEHRYGDEDDAHRHVFLSCPDCGGPFVVHQHGNMYRSDHGTGYVLRWEDKTVVFPADPQSLDPSVPINIATSYLEARRVYTAASANTAAAIMCRRTLEGICGHLEAKGGNLAKKLDNLKERGLIEPRIHEWANHVLRSLGNDAAHDVDAVISKEDAKDALDFTKAIIEYIFVFETAFQRFKKRRTKEEAPAQPPS